MRPWRPTFSVSCSAWYLTFRRHLIVYAAPADRLQEFRLIVDSGSG
jgi:hypothetical protein